MVEAMVGRGGEGLVGREGGKLGLRGWDWVLGGVVSAAGWGVGGLISRLGEGWLLGGAVPWA